MSATVFTSSVARVSFLLNMDVVIVPPFKSYRLIISAPSPMCSRAKTTLVWAPLILILAFADRFLNEWNLDSITAQIAMVSSSALTLVLAWVAAWLKEYGILYPVENVIFKMRLRPTFFELSEAMRSTFSLLPIGLSPVDGRFVLEVDEALLWLGGGEYPIYHIYPLKRIEFRNRPFIRNYIPGRVPP